MSFINPALLWGMAAVSVPIVIFLIFRRKFKRVDWAAMEFLLRAQRRTNKRLKIENLLLLLIRCLILAFLALALARPKVTSFAGGGLLAGESNHHILLLDCSYSMNYQIDQVGNETFMSRLQKEALGILNSMAPEDEVSVIRITEHSDLVVENNIGKDDYVLGRISDTEASHQGADLGAALVKAQQVIEQSNKHNQLLYLITDFQASTFFREPSSAVDSDSIDTDEDGGGDTLNTIEILTKELSILDNVSFYILDIGDEAASNRQIRDLQTPELKIIAGIETEFTVEAFNASNQPDQNYDVIFRVDGEEIERNMIDTLPGRESAECTFTHVFDTPGFHYVAAEAADTSKDFLTVDDVRYLAVEILPSIRVLVVNGEVGSQYDDEVFYLKTLLTQEELGGGSRLPVKADFLMEAELSVDTFADYDVVLMCNVSTLETSIVDALDEYVRDDGRSVVWFLGDQVDATFYNARLYNNAEGLLPAKLKGVEGDPQRKSFVYMQPKNFDHPLLNYAYYSEHPVLFKMPFIYEYYSLESYDFDPTVRTVLSYNNGVDAAILEKFVGNGKSLMITTTVDAEWTNLPAFPIYVALIGDMIFYLAYQDRSDLNLHVGGRIIREYPLDYTDTPQMFTPEQGNVNLESTTVNGRARQVFYDKTNHAGIYQLFAPLQDDEEDLTLDLDVYFSVNVDPEEGNLYRATEQQLKARYPAFEFVYKKYNPENSIVRNQDEENRLRELWKYFAFAVLGLLLIESLLAQRFGQYKRNA